jgi:hypothetical protein
LSVFILLVAAYTAIAPNFDQPFVSYGFASAVIFWLSQVAADCIGPLRSSRR